MNIDELLDVMDETLEEAVNLPFTGGKRMVDVEKVRDIIDELSLIKGIGGGDKVSEEDYPYLGVQLKDISENMVTNYGMPAGILVYYVEENSPAQVAGIMAAKKAVIRAVRPGMRLDGKSAAYINAAYDYAVADVNSRDRKDTSYQIKQMFNQDGRQPAPADDGDSSIKARQRMIDRQQNKKKEDK